MLYTFYISIFSFFHVYGIKQNGLHNLELLFLPILLLKANSLEAALHVRKLKQYVGAAKDRLPDILVNVCRTQQQILNSSSTDSVCKTIKSAHAQWIRTFLCNICLNR